MNIKITRNKGTKSGVIIHLPTAMFGNTWVEFRNNNKAAIEAAKLHVQNTGKTVVVADSNNLKT